METKRPFKELLKTLKVHVKYKQNYTVFACICVVLSVTIVSQVALFMVSE